MWCAHSDPSTRFSATATTAVSSRVASYSVPGHPRGACPRFAGGDQELFHQRVCGAIHSDPISRRRYRITAGRMSEGERARKVAHSIHLGVLYRCMFCQGSTWRFLGDQGAKEIKQKERPEREGVLRACTHNAASGISR